MKLLLIFAFLVFVIIHNNCKSQDKELELRVAKLETALEKNKELFITLMERIISLENKIDKLSSGANKIESPENLDNTNNIMLQNQTDEQMKKDDNKIKVIQKVQCKGKTKKGKRCSRMTDDPSGYCWQHKR